MLSVSEGCYFLQFSITISHISRPTSEIYYLIFANLHAVTSSIKGRHYNFRGRHYNFRGRHFEFEGGISTSEGGTTTSKGNNMTLRSGTSN